MSISDQHKNSQLFQTLRNQIEDGTLPGGDRLPPERKMADIYNCSRVTVRNSLDQLEQIGLIKKIRGSGSFVSKNIEIKRRLKRIGFIISAHKDLPDISNFNYITEMLMNIQRDRQDNSCSFHLIQQLENEKLVDCFKNNNLPLNEFDGLLIRTNSLKDEDVRYLHRNKIPFVSCVPSKGMETVSYIDTDNAKGAYLATNHLLSLGRKNINFLNGSTAFKYNADKLEGFKAALKEHEITFQNYMHKETQPTKHIEAGEIVKEMIKDRQNKPFDALIVYGDWATFGAVQALRESGLRVPEDVSIIMYDDRPWVSKTLNLPITSIRQPLTKQADKMLSNLLRMIDNPENTSVIEILKPELIVRKSCGSGN